MRYVDGIDFYVSAKLRERILAATLSVQAARISILQRKAGFRPDQQRIPAGEQGGGQWADEDGSGISQSDGEEGPQLWLVGEEQDRLPEIPRERPPTVRERTGWAIRLVKYLYVMSLPVRAVVVARWLEEHASNRITAYLEPPKGLQNLRKPPQITGQVLRSTTL